jgi:nucleotide-binding universal stress UspA family protein
MARFPCLLGLSSQVVCTFLTPFMALLIIQRQKLKPDCIVNTESMNSITWFVNSRATIEPLFRSRESAAPCVHRSHYLNVGNPPNHLNETGPVKSSVSPCRNDEIEATGCPAIVVPVDFSPCSQNAIEVGVSIACETHAKLILCHAICPQLASFAPDSPPWLTEGLRSEVVEKIMAPALNLAKEAGLTATSIVEEGTPAGVILKVARRFAANLIVLTAQERSAWARLLFGPTITEQVIRAAGCHVMVVPADVSL